MSLGLVVVSIQNIFHENRTSICTFAVTEQKKLLKSFASIHRSIITFSFMLTIFGDCCMMLWCCFLTHLLQLVNCADFENRQMLNKQSRQNGTNKKNYPRKIRNDLFVEACDCRNNFLFRNSGKVLNGRDLSIK